MRLRSDADLLLDAHHEASALLNGLVVLCAARAPDMRTSSTSSLSPAVGFPTLVFQTRMFPLANSGTRDYDIAPDGRFLVGTIVGPSKGTAATILLNWPTATKR